MKHIRHAAAAVALFAFVGVASAVTVSSTLTTPTDLGFFAAGTYQLTGTGVIDLVGSGGTFPINPDGLPAPIVTEPGYSLPTDPNNFNPNGRFEVNAITFGPAGSNAKIGALAGTLTATPTSSADFFLIGTSKTLTLASPGNIYALVNDVFYPNNVGSFEVTVSAVPEPAQAALLLAGLGVVGVVGRRRSRTN